MPKPAAGTQSAAFRHENDDESRSAARSVVIAGRCRKLAGARSWSVSVTRRRISTDSGGWRPRLDICGAAIPRHHRSLAARYTLAHSPRRYEDRSRRRSRHPCARVDPLGGAHRRRLPALASARKPAQFMRHVARVTESADGTSHWVAAGPAGLTVEWDAEIVNEIENKVLAWRSLQSSDIVTAGSVNFDAARGGRSTRTHGASAGTHHPQGRSEALQTVARSW